jgi:DNA-binding response OmpR family regulator
MEAPARSSRRVRTGLFEIDFVSGDVHKEGRRVPLQEQPFRVLAVLLECPGEIVTREQLRARLRRRLKHRYPETAHCFRRLGR